MTEKMVIREYYELCDGGICQDLLTEAEKRFVTNGGMILSGVIQRCGVPNGNGRIYTEGVLKREIGLYEKLVKENRALGELDHPESNIVNLANVSHKMTAVWMEGEDVYGKLQVLDTPSGKILRATIRKIADGEDYKMPATIDDPAILGEITQSLIEKKILNK